MPLVVQQRRTAKHWVVRTTIAFPSNVDIVLNFNFVGQIYRSTTKTIHSKRPKQKIPRDRNKNRTLKLSKRKPYGQVTLFINLTHLC